LVTEVLRHPRAIHGCPQAHQGCIIRWRGDHYRAGHALFAENLFDELLHLPAPLANQADDGDIRLGKAGHHAQQHALAHAAAGKQAQTLAAAYGEHAVDRPNAHIQRRLDGMALEWVDHRARQVDPVFAFEGALAIQWSADAVEYPAQHFVAHRQLAATGCGYYPCSGLQPLHAIHRHQIDLAAGKAHDLGLDPGFTLRAVAD